MHISAGTGNTTWDSLVQDDGKYAAITCFPEKEFGEGVGSSGWDLVRLKHTALHSVLEISLSNTGFITI